MTPDADDRLIAAVDVIGRSGAKNFEVGYLHDDVPAAEADWWASCRYAGTIIMVEHQGDPWTAAEELAVKVLTGGQCQGCGSLVALTDEGGFAFFHATLLDGRSWDAVDAADAGLCRWQRIGKRWERECDDFKTPPPPPARPTQNRAQRRGNKQRRRRH